MTKVSAPMWLMLNYMAAANGHAIATRNDPTFRALERRGLAVFVRTGSKYGRNHWRITPAGLKALEPVETRR